MGKRARRAGLSNAALRRARAGSAREDREAHELAQSIYVAARGLRTEGGDIALAPIIVVAELAAPAVAERLGLKDPGEEVLGDVAAFLVTAWLNGLVACGREDFEAWRSRVTEEEAERG